jgi:hypothetical protein
MRMVDISSCHGGVEHKFDGIVSLLIDYTTSHGELNVFHSYISNNTHLLSLNLSNEILQ